MRSLRESSGAKAVLAVLALTTFVWGTFAMVPNSSAAQRHTEGSVVVDGGTVWYIGANERRGFPNAEIFLSHGYSFGQLQAALPGDMNLPVGSVMTWADGTLVNDGGTIYMVYQGVRRGFVSGAVFTGMGFSFGHVMNGSTTGFSNGANVESVSETHPAGTLVINNGTVWQIRPNGRAGVESMAVFNSNGWSFAKVVAANAADMALPDLGLVSARPTGNSVIDDGQQTPSNVSVSVAPTNPASSTLIAGQTMADLAHFTFSGSGNITSVTVERFGVSGDSTLENLYLFDGAVRLTDAASIGANSRATFAANPIFTVNGSKTISVKADVANNTAGQSVGIRIVAYSVGGSSANVSVSGNTHNIAADPGLAAAEFGSTISNAGDIEPGSDITVWEGTLTVQQRAVNMTRLALRQIGNISPSDINNFRLFIDGVQVASAAGVDSNGYVTFAFNQNLTNTSHTIRVIADIIGGSSRTVQMSLRTAADVSLTDSSYGVGIAATVNGGNFPLHAANPMDIQGASVTVVKATDSPSGNVVKDATDQVLGKFTITAFGEAVKVENLTVGVEFNGSASTTVDLRNGRLLVNGVQYGSTTTLQGESTGTTFTTNFVVTPGNPATVEVRADIFDNSGTNNFDDVINTIAVSLIQGNDNGQGQTSLDAVDVPIADVPANTLSIGTAGLTLAKNLAYANPTVVAPANDFKLASFNLVNNSAGDVNVNNIIVDFDNNTGLNENHLSNVYVKYGANQTSPKASVATSSNAFSVSFTLAQNSSMLVEVFANVSGNPDNGHTLRTDMTVNGNAVVGGSSVTTSEEQGQTTTVGTGTLVAAVDASTPSEALLEDNSTKTVAAYEFRTTNEAFTLTEVSVRVINASSVTGLRIKDGSTTVGTGFGGSTATSTIGVSVNVPANSTKVLTVELDLGQVASSGGATTGENVQAKLVGWKASKASGGQDTATNLGLDGNAMYVYAAIPSIQTQSISSILTPGTSTATVGKFTVSSTGGPISWGRIVFDYATSSGVGLSNATLWDVTGGTPVQVTASSTGEFATQVDLQNRQIVFAPLSEQLVNGSKTYELRVDVTGATTNSSISTRIDQPVAHVAPATFWADVATNSTFTWSDRSNVSHSLTTSDWNNSYLIQTLPTSYQSVSVSN